jgi:heme-degrading monooxygenase HmoA
VPTDEGFMIIETWESEEAIEDFTTSKRFRQETGVTGIAPAGDQDPPRARHAAGELS